MLPSNTYRVDSGSGAGAHTLSNAVTNCMRLSLAQHTLSCQLKALSAELRHAVQPPQPAVTMQNANAVHR